MSTDTKHTIPQVHNFYDKFITDERIDELELGLSIPNIFEILKVSGKEIRHSNFLAWLLNPNGSHGLGDLFLKRFLRELFASDKAKGLDPISVMEADLSKARIKREWKHIDLLIEMEKIVILIENKFYSGESKGQLQKYKKKVDKEYPTHKKVYAFLTPDGVESEAEKDSFQEISYQTVINIIEKILKIFDQNLNPSSRVYLTDYQTILKRELMSGDKLSELAQRIYYSHKELMDFIIENRPDAIDEVREKLIEVLKKNGYKIGSKSKRYARFYTGNINEFIYRSKKKMGWEYGESFLFEIHVSNNKLTMSTVIPPTDNEYDRNQLADVLKEIEGSQKPRNDTWMHHFDKSFSFDADNLYYMEDEEIENIFEKFLNSHIEPIVKKVEEAFEENRKVLLKLKEDAEKQTTDQ